MPATNLIELPDNVSFEEAAMLEPMAVAVHAIRGVFDTGRIRENTRGRENTWGREKTWSREDTREILTGKASNSQETVCTDAIRGLTGNMQADIQEDNIDRSTSIAVYGLGTIGMFIVMLLKAAGYNNQYLIGNKESQKRNIAALGIPEDSYYDNSVIIRERQEDGRGADIVFECVGRTQTYADAIDIAAPMGKVMLVGNPYSDMTLPRNTYWKILRNQLTVLGTWNSSFTGKPGDDWHYVLELIKNGSIEPKQFISHRFPLGDLKKGLDIMHNKTEEYGKIMMI